ncbi:pericentrin isoform X8 [Macaca nemestrina]|uniref:pericentrin isoform X8 n=1 Tax=Macaca nemestrina TaxID=9545 RepID=UPI0039B8D05C
MEVEQEQRRRKVEAGRTKLAHFRQRKTKGDGSHSEKKTAKRKGSAVDAPVQEESPIAKEDCALRGGGDICKSTSCDDTPDGAGGAFAAQLEYRDGEKREDLEQLQQKQVSDHPPEQRGIFTVSDPRQEQRGMFTVSDRHPEQRGMFTVSDHPPEQRGMFTVSDPHPEQRGIFTVSDHHPEQRGIFTVSDPHPEQRGIFTVSDPHPEQRGIFTVSDHHPEQRGIFTVSDPHPEQCGIFTVSDHHPEQRGIFTVSDHHPEQRGIFTVSDPHPEQRGIFTVSDPHPEQRGIFTVSDPHPEQRGIFTVSDPHPEQRGIFTVSDPHPEQREVITKECKQECELAITDLQSSREEEAGLQQSQAVHGLELEALRLSLSNMHTAQLELTQANLQKEKETALTELREMLNSRRAQELALLQSRQQHELELLREQHAREKEEVVLRCGQEAAELKEKLQSEMEKNAQIEKTLKEDWESEKDLCLENLRKELSAKHQSEMEDLQNQFQKELAEQRAELEKIFQDKNQAESALRNLESQHQAAIEKLREDLQSEHCRCLEDLEFKFKESEKEKQLELENLQASYEDLKAQSQEEIRRLWSQLDSARTSRQELSELHEQLLARASHVEDLEQLKQREKTQHESELEQLRIYFEKKLRDAEKTYQEDLTLLQRRLQGASADALLDPVEVGLSCVGLEEKPEKERKDHVDELNPERLKESLPCFQAELEESHRHLLEAPESPLCIQREGHVSDRRCAETSALGQGWRLEPSEGRSQGLPWVHLQGVQDRALEADTEVAARVLGLETEHKVKLSLLQTELKEEIELLKIENRNLYEKLQHETRLKENLEKVKHNLVEDHQEELNNAKQKTELMKQEFQKKEMDWKVMKEELQREAEEKLTLMLLELREKAESEKQTIVNKFELREAEMRQLQDQQAAQILDLERSLTEQQGRLQQLEQELTSDDALRCSQCGREPPTAQDGELAALHVKEDCALQLILARSRFLEERKEITEKFSAEQDAFLREAQEQHTRELQLLQERHQQRLLSVTAELEARHQAALGELTASLESKQGALLAARVAELQTEHAADLSALETRHLSSLDSLESCYLSEIQTIREEHRRALELLRADFEEQLRKQDSLHQTILTQELEKLKQKHDEELQSVRDGLRTAASTELAGTVAHELQEAHQGEFGSEKKAALHEKEKTLWLQSAQAQPFHQEEKESLSLQLQKKNHQVQQLKDQVLSLSHEIEECRSELEALQQRRERENREGANLLSMLKADVDLSHSERGALQDALRRLLGLFGETLRAAITLRSRIGERVGLCLDDAGAGLALSAAPAQEETWSDVALPELDRTLSECAEMSSVAEISSHMRESFLMSPESVRECEQPIRRVFQSLSLAVDGLLEMALDSSRQLEEARQIHSRFEKEFSFKNEETAQVVRKHQELLECLKEESAAKAELALELHKTQGTLEGFKVETADLKETLAGKEDSEHRLVLELESLRRQLQQAAQEQAALREECTRLWSRGEATAMDAEAREAGTAVTVAHKDSALRKEVEDLTREQSETRKQAEKDRSALLSQMKILESELEEQLSQHRGCAKQAEAVTALEQQVASLDKHLRNQRQFMDEQAAEREHEREEFQQEIQRLEGQLRQVAKPQPWGPHDSQQAPLDGEVELLQQKLREKLDEFNELALQKESADRQVLRQEEEIKRLEETNINIRKKMAELQEEVEKQKNIVKELVQDKELLKKQQMSSLLLASTLQSTLDAGSCPEPPPGSPPEGPEVQLEVTQSALLQRESEVLDLKEQLEKMKGDLESKNEEILHLNLKLDLKNSQTAVRLGELQEESVSSKGDLQPVLMTLEDAPLCKQEGVMSVLTVCQRQLQSELLLVKNEMRLSLEDVGKGKEKVLEDCQLQKVDLIAQVKQLQEKLNRLLYSMTFQNVDAADAKSPWPLASAHLLESSWSDGSCDGEEPDTSAPTDACDASAATGGVTDVIKNRDSLIPDEMPDSPIQEKSECQDRSLSSPTSMLGGSCHQSHAAEAGPRKSPVGMLDLSSWSSPEVLRKDWSLEPRPSLPVTPHSGALSLCSADTSLRDRADTSLPQPQGPGLLCSPGVSAAALALQWAESPPADDHRVQRTAVEKDVEDFITTSLDSQETLSSSPPGLEGKTDGSEKSDGSGFGARLSLGSGGPEAPTAGPVTPAAISGRFQPLPEAMKEKEVHPQHVKALLQMVCDESHQILALSEGLAPLTGEPHPPRKGDKDVPTVCPDWRGELLQVVQEAFEKEPEIQGVELQPRLSGSDLGGHSFPLERLEKVISEQGDLQEKSLEQLRLPDRSSLLSEIQALRAQLRMVHLQNQEKLQHLRTALTSAEARGSQQEHQLRKQVELLVYKVEQEKCIAGDLQKTLSEEQEKANGVQKLLAAEQSVVRDLKSELCESRQESERLSRSLCEVQQEVLQLRSMLSSKENELKAALQELESEQGKGRALQSQLEEEQLRHLQREGQSAKALEELRASLEGQRAQSSRLCVALKHEQTAKDNLQKELRIEHSRCEALLAQERSQLSELQKDLAAEKSRTLELSEALRHERLLTEQLSQRTQEACVHQDTQAHHALLRKLKDEKSRVADLQAMLEKVQQQALRSQQQLEAEAQEHCEALRREKEVSATLKSTVEALHTQKRELRCSLEREREKPAWLQAELEQSHPRLKEQEGRKASRRSMEAGQSPAAAERWRKWQRDKEKLRELELQRQRDLHKIQQLQQTVRDLEPKDEVPGSRLHLGSARRAAGLDADHLREQQRELEAMRQRLLCAAGLLTGFASQAMDRTVNDWTSSNEKAVVSLLHTLEELKSDLSRPTCSQKKMAAELQLQFVDVLLKDNVSLTKALSTVTREKLELSRAVSKLEKMLKHHLQKGCSPSKSERAAWKPDETAPQSSLRRPDPGRLPPAASEEAHPSNVKMEKLYLHYLRAESFRKALIYQKKYLLLLIGGFQDSEQETLSMIAHLGVFPSKAERKTTSRPFTRFRTAVRVVVAVLRLRFLVKKWQEVDRKGALAQGKVPRPGPRVRRPQSPPRTRESPPTRDVPSGHTRDPARGHGLAAAASPHTGGRATPSPNSRLERSLTASQDPEHSLTEYIHHLEVIQQRLGGALPDSPSKKSCHQKIKQ